ncbi:unnamed protein product [Sphacelaria rigidula]
MGTDFASNRAAWLVAGFLGRKVIKDLLGRWSIIPVLAVGVCVWSKWKTRQEELKSEREKLEEMRRETRVQQRPLNTKSSPGGGCVLGSAPPLGGSGNTVANANRSSHVSPSGRLPGDRLGGVPSSSVSSLVSSISSATSATGGATAQDTALAKSEWFSWLGVGVGRNGGSCRGGDRSRSRAGEGGGEWRGAFRNGMRGIPRRNAFKTARGKVYLRSGNGRPLNGKHGARGDERTIGGLASVREEDEGVVPP